MPPALPTVNPVALLFIFVLMASVVGAWIWAILRGAFGMPVLPRFEPKLVSWGGKSVLAVILGWLAVQVGVQYAFLLVTRGTLVRPKEGRVPFNPAEMMTASAVQNAATLVLIPLLLSVICRARPRDFVGSGRRWGWQTLQGMVAWPLAAPLVYGMMLAAVAVWGRESHPLETAIQSEGLGGRSVIFFLAGVVLAPAAEELIFRGVILGWLTTMILQPRPARPEQPATRVIHRKDNDETLLAPTPTIDLLDDLDNPYAPPQAALDQGHPDDEFAPPLGSRTGPGVVVRLATANVGVSILFATLHYTVWPTPVPIFFLSLVLGLLYQRTGSLIAPVALHMTFNGVSTILMFLTIGMNPQLNTPTKPLPAPAPVPKPVDPITQPPVAIAGVVLDQVAR